MLLFTLGLPTHSVAFGLYHNLCSLVDSIPTAYNDTPPCKAVTYSKGNECTTKFVMPIVVTCTMCSPMCTAQHSTSGSAVALGSNDVSA